MNNFVWLGGNTYVPYEEILLLTDYGEPQAKKMVKNARELERLMDYSRGQSKETVAVMKTGFVIITPVELYEVLRTHNEHMREGK